MLNDGNVTIKERKCVIFDQFEIRLLFVKVGETFLLYVGDECNHQSVISNLSLAIAKSTTTVIGNDCNKVEQSLAEKLSARFNDNKPVYVSYNYPDIPFRNDEFVLNVHKNVVDFVKHCLNK